MNEIKENQVEVNNLESIMSTGDDLWYDFTPPSNFDCTAKYRSLSTQNILEVYINGSSSGVSGSLTVGTLPQRVRPSTSGFITGIVSTTSSGVTTTKPEILNISTDGEVTIPATSSQTIKIYAFYGMIDL